MRIFMVKTLHDKPDARALQMSACAAMQQGVELLRGRVQCVGEGRESSPFEGIALEDPRPQQMGRPGVAATRVAGLAVEAARNPIFAS